MHAGDSNLVQAMGQIWGRADGYPDLTSCDDGLTFLAVSAKHEQEHGAFSSANETQRLLTMGQQAQDSRTQLSEEMLSAFLGSSEEFAPVNSIVGGILANEVLKCISKKGEPLNNVFCYSMLDGGGVVESLVLST